MAGKHTRSADRTHLMTKETPTEVTWSCRSCKKTGRATDRGTALSQFDNHTCNVT